MWEFNPARDPRVTISSMTQQPGNILKLKEVLDPTSGDRFRIRVRLYTAATSFCLRMLGQSEGLNDR